MRQTLEDTVQLADEYQHEVRQLGKQIGDVRVSMCRIAEIAQQNAALAEAMAGSVSTARNRIEETVQTAAVSEQVASALCALLSRFRVRGDGPSISGGHSFVPNSIADFVRSEQSPPGCRLDQSR